MLPSEEIKIPIRQVVEQIKNDPELYCAYQANIAMAFYDEYNRSKKKYKNKTDIHEIANNAAKNFLTLWTAI